MKNQKITYYFNIKFTQYYSQNVGTQRGNKLITRSIITDISIFLSYKPVVRTRLSVLFV